MTGKTLNTLFLLKFSLNSETVIIDLFKDFYPFKKALIELIVKEHKFYI
jgi:hypothetical protein